jgi:glycerol-1-phosphatase
VRPADRFDAFLLDLDGVLYRGDDPVPGARETLDALRAAGKSVVFVTNNSWRTPAQVAAKLGGIGIRAEEDEVVTSGQATAAMLRRDAAGSGRDSGLTAYVLGGEGVRTALADAGIEPVDGEPDGVDLVVVGWDRRLTYDRLRTATVLVGRGARLVATNADASYPGPGGELWPGAGAILAAVEAGSRRRAEVAGKPRRPLLDLAVERAGSRNAVVVGDRLETDVVGAANAELPSAFVLTGASSQADLLASEALPAMVLDDLTGLLEDRAVVRFVPATADHDAGIRDLLDRSGLGAEGGWVPDGVTVAGLVDGAVAATAAADVRAPDAYVRSVAVREDLRHQHAGTLAVAAAAREARRWGASTLWLVTETAASFFERLGFEPVDRNVLPAWIAERSHQCRESATAMRRDVAQYGS